MGDRRIGKSIPKYTHAIAALTLIVYTCSVKGGEKEMSLAGLRHTVLRCLGSFILGMLISWPLYAVLGQEKFWIIMRITVVPAVAVLLWYLAEKEKERSGR